MQVMALSFLVEVGKRSSQSVGMDWDRLLQATRRAAVANKFTACRAPQTFYPQAASAAWANTNRVTAVAVGARTVPKCEEQQVVQAGTVSTSYNNRQEVINKVAVTMLVRQAEKPNGAAHTWTWRFLKRRLRCTLPRDCQCDGDRVTAPRPFLLTLVTTKRSRVMPELRGTHPTEHHHE